MEVLTFWAVLAALVIFVAYNTISVGVFGIPHSLSMTYYLWKEETGRGWYFSLMMYAVVALMMPAWITMSEGSDFQFLAFLAPAAIAFVGTAPRFKDTTLENHVHMTSAYLAAAFALLWVALVTPYWLVILIWFYIVASLSLFTNSYKTALVYWLETIAFGSTFTATIIYSL